MNELKKIIASLNKKDYKPVYFLMGEEPFYIDYISNFMINHVIPEDEKDFNQVIVYGKDIEVNELISQARQYPFMGERILLVVREAQELHKSIELFADYLKFIQPTTTVVIGYKYKTLDKRKALYKALSKSPDVVIFESKKIKDYQIDGWINSYVSDHNLQIEPKAVAMLSEFLGNDLSKIVNEIDKLKIVLKNQNTITADAIEEHIGISKEYNNFEFISTIAQRNEVKAFDIAKNFALNTKNNPLVVTIAILYNFFSRLLQYHGLTHKNNGITLSEIAKHIGVPEFGMKDYQIAVKNYPMRKVSHIIEVIRIIDLKSKGVDANAMPHDELLKELLIKIFR